MKYREIKERLETIESYIEAAKGYVMGEEEEETAPPCAINHIKYNLIEAVNEIANFTNAINRDNRDR